LPWLQTQVKRPPPSSDLRQAAFFVDQEAFATNFFAMLLASYNVLL
jgi:hypothetical protein